MRRRVFGSRPGGSGTFDVLVSDDEDEVCVRLEVCWELTAYDPGRTDDIPERCYPAEGGDLEIESIRLYEFGRWYHIDEAEVAEYVDLYDATMFEAEHNNSNDECGEPDDYDEPSEADYERIENEYERQFD